MLRAILTRTTRGFGDAPTDEKKDESTGPVRIDLDGIESRVVAFPVPDGGR